MLWVIGSACAAFILTVILEGTNAWRPIGRPVLYHFLQGCKAFLWLPAPVFTTVILDSYIGDSYSIFVIWGTLGYALQLIGHWIRMNNEWTIQHAFHEWMQLSDRRFWELQLKGASRFPGALWSDIAAILSFVWVIGLGLGIRVEAYQTAAYHGLGWTITGVAVVAVLIRVCSVWGREFATAPLWVQRVAAIRVVLAIADVVLYGLLTGWLLVMGTLGV